MLALRPALAALLLGLSLAPLACSGEQDVGTVADHHEDGSEDALASVSAALNPNDTVATAIAQSCTTTVVKGLAVQLVDEIQCLHPGTFVAIDKTPGLSLGSAVFPYLQTKAAAGLIAAQKARGTTMTINSALRTLPQQFLLYRWYQTGRCGISLAATPGTSNHEGGIAVDVDDNAGWRTSMTNAGFRWLGASDPVHYDFVAGGTLDLRGVSVTAFQRLWNRNNPGDMIAEDGQYGPTTESKLAASPAAGFPKGASCSTAAPDAGDAGKHPADSGAPSAEPPAPTGPSPAPGAPAKASNTNAAEVDPSGAPPAAESGCALAPGAARSGSLPRGGAALLAVAGVVAATIARRRRRRD